jgi:hypothetical protein
MVGRNGDRIAHHAGFVPLDLEHLGGLQRRRQVLVDDADAAFLRQRDGEAGLGHRVHGGRDERQVQSDLAGQLGREAGLAGQNGRIGRQQENIVEGQGLLDQPHRGSSWRKAEL